MADRDTIVEFLGQVTSVCDVIVKGQILGKS